MEFLARSEVYLANRLFGKDLRRRNVVCKKGKKGLKDYIY
jgi:hypothetical protein